MFKRMKVQKEQTLSLASGGEDDDRGASSVASLSDTTLARHFSGKQSENDSDSTLMIASSQPFPSSASDVEFVDTQRISHRQRSQIIQLLSSDGEVDIGDDIERKSVGISGYNKARDKKKVYEGRREVELDESPERRAWKDPMLQKYEKWLPEISFGKIVEPKFSFSAIQCKPIHTRKIERWNQEYNGFGKLIEPFISIRLGVDGKLQYLCNACGSNQSENDWRILKRTSKVIEHLIVCPKTNVAEEEGEAVQEAIKELSAAYERDVAISRRASRKKEIQKKANEIMKQIEEQRAIVLKDLVAIFFKQTGLEITPTRLLQLKIYLRDLITQSNSAGLVSSDAVVISARSLREELDATVLRLIGGVSK